MHAHKNEAEITQSQTIGLRVKRETDLPSVFEKENEL